MPVTGIGGVFLRSRDPEARAAWYREHLGIDAGQTSLWRQSEGDTVFAPLPFDDDSFASDQPLMLNLRVSGIDALIASLTAAGVPVETRAEWDGEYGRFARLHDPEGLPIELWEPPATEADE